MKLQTLIKKLKEIPDFGMQKFWDKDFEGSCPCFEGHKLIEGKSIRVEGRCWRVVDNPDEQELYVWGDWDKLTLKKVGKEIKRALDAQEWYSPYKLIIKCYE